MVFKSFHNESRWLNHGKPPGADVAAIADAAAIRPQVIFTIRSPLSKRVFMSFHQ